MNFSIVIPTKNRPRYVKHQLETLINQKIKILEVIIIDDSTNCLTKNVVENMREVYTESGVSLFYMRGAGSLARARLLGGLKSRGDIVVFIDDDLELKEKALENLINSFENNVMAAWGLILFTDRKKKLLTDLFSRFYYRFLFGSAWIFGGGFFAVRRKVFEDKIWPDWSLSGYSLYEDKDFARNIYSKYGPIKIKLVDSALSINREVLQKSEGFYLQSLGSTFYYAWKWGGFSHLLLSPFITLILAIAYVINIDGRGYSVNKLKVIPAFFKILIKLKFIVSGRLCEVYV